VFDRKVSITLTESAAKILALADMKRGRAQVVSYSVDMKTSFAGINFCLTKVTHNSSGRLLKVSEKIQGKNAR